MKPGDALEIGLRPEPRRGADPDLRDRQAETLADSAHLAMPVGRYRRQIGARQRTLGTLDFAVSQMRRRTFDYPYGSTLRDAGSMQAGDAFEDRVSIAGDDTASLTERQWNAGPKPDGIDGTAERRRRARRAVTGSDGIHGRSWIGGVIGARHALRAHEKTRLRPGRAGSGHSGDDAENMPVNPESGKLNQNEQGTLWPKPRLSSGLCTHKRARKHRRARLGAHPLAPVGGALPGEWRPLGDSNPCYRRERAMS